MKESLLKFLKTNKDKPVFVALRITLGIMLYPVSNLYLVKWLEGSLSHTLNLKMFREFLLSWKTPNFSDLRASHFLYYKNKFPPWLNRGFYARECIKEGDVVLDIGCGNGFFDQYFFVDVASKIDAIDIEEDAIINAKKNNAHEKIRYFRLDAVTGAFPSEKYDVIIMNSSIMYFKKKEIPILMNKILNCMNDDSIFTGSITMQPIENSKADGPQVFSTESEVKEFLAKYFNNIHVWTRNELVYKQAYFRCTKANLS